MSKRKIQGKIEQSTKRTGSVAKTLITNNLTSQIEYPFYSYYISLSSFINLHDEPFTKTPIEKGDFNDNPLLSIGVLGKQKSGKTKLINELSKRLNQNQGDTSRKFDENLPNAIYYKSFNYSQSSTLLFMKGPPLNNCIKGKLTKELIFDRDIMTKFVIGYFAWFSDVLIIVVDENSVNDYEDYYSEIQSLRNPRDNLLIVHNISNEKHKDELLTRLENDKIYDKNNFNTLGVNSISTQIEYYYKVKSNPTLIHLLYNPKTNEEAKLTTIPIIKKNNTSMINFLVSCIQIQTPKQKKRSILESFDLYLTNFLGQLYDDSSIKSIETKTKAGTEIRINKLSMRKGIMASHINMDVVEPKRYYPDFAYKIEDKKRLIIDINIPTYTNVTQTCLKVVGDTNVLEYHVTDPNVNNTLTDDKKDKTILALNNLPKQFDFVMRIPTNDCVILKQSKVNKTIQGRRLQLTLPILEEAEEEVVDFI